jgi:hypothetical protein
MTDTDLGTGVTVVGQYGLRSNPSAAGFAVKDLDIHLAQDVSGTAPDGRGKSTYGVHLDNCSNFVLSRMRITTGAGSDGASGNPGENGTAGGAGQDGGVGKQDIFNDCGHGGGGGAGGNGLPGQSNQINCSSDGSLGSQAPTERAGGGLNSISLFLKFPPSRTDF